MFDLKKVFERPGARFMLRDLDREAAAAVVELLYVLVATDDEVSDDEMDEVRAQLERLSFHWARDEKEVRALVAQAWQLGTAFESSQRIKSYLPMLVEKIPQGEVRQVVLQMAMCVCASDGLADSERDVLAALRAELGVSEADYARLRDGIEGATF